MAHFASASLYNVTSGGNGWCSGEGAAACGNPNAFGEGILDCDYPAKLSDAERRRHRLRRRSRLLSFHRSRHSQRPRRLCPDRTHGAATAGPASVRKRHDRHLDRDHHLSVPQGQPHLRKLTNRRWYRRNPTTTGSATHDYTTAATRTITLTVTDSYGVTATTTSRR